MLSPSRTLRGIPFSLRTFSMATLLFDTLKFAKTLESSGIPHEQAEALREVTRDYLDAKLETIKADLLKWMAGMLLAQVAVVAALVKLL